MPTARARSRPSLVVQVDTASGIVNDIAALGAAIGRSGHGALFMVDVIASLASMPFEMDAWGIDVAVGGAQKGLMMTPGLSFVARKGKGAGGPRQRRPPHPLLGDLDRALRASFTT